MEHSISIDDLLAGQTVLDYGSFRFVVFSGSTLDVADFL